MAVKEAREEISLHFVDLDLLIAPNNIPPGIPCSVCKEKLIKGARKNPLNSKSFNTEMCISSDAE